jgi:hypothetical protein
MANTKQKATVKKKEPTEKEILKQLKDPNLSKAKKNALVEKLYRGIQLK